MCFFKLFKRNKNKKDTASEPVKTETVPETVEEPVKAVEEVKPAVEVQPKSEPVKVQPKAEKPAVNNAAVKADNGKVLVRMRYNRSFAAKLIQSDDKLKSYYGEIKNELMRYKVKTRTSWKYETFKHGRKLLAKIAVRGKTLGLYLALDPAAYAGTKYKINDVSSVAKNAAVPVLYKIKNDRRCKYSKDLIAAVMSANGLEAGEEKTDDYVARYPYEEIEPLIERGLVKLLKWKENSAGAEEGLIEISQERYEAITAETNYSEVAVSEDEPVEEEPVDEEPQYPEVVESITVVEAEEKIADEVVEDFVQESERYSDKTKKDIVNIDVLSKYFNAGENVTVEEIKKRVPSVNRKTTYIKVLARGTLDKALNVEADDFTPAAIKMIVLTGGTVSRTKTRN